MTGSTNKRRKPYPRVRKPRKTIFTPDIWAQWMLENGSLTAPDQMTVRLRAGIAEFRHRLRVASHREVHT